MGQQQAAHHQQQSQGQATSPNKSNSPPLSGLASGLRPHYFSKSSTLSAVLSGKSASSAYPTPPSSPAMHASNKANVPSAAAQQAMLASMASQTLLGKLGNAFWDAFSGEPTARVGTSRSAWDAEKVRKVLEGKAVVRVVDVEPKVSVAQTPAPAIISEKAGPSRLPTRSPTIEQSKRAPAACLEKMFDGLRL